MERLTRSMWLLIIISTAVNGLPHGHKPDVDNEDGNFYTPHLPCPLGTKTRMLHRKQVCVPLYMTRTVILFLWKGRPPLRLRRELLKGQLEQLQNKITGGGVCPEISQQTLTSANVALSDRCHNHDSRGSRCLFRCKYGYASTGKMSIECLSSGLWSNSVPQCKPLYCPKLDAVSESNSWTCKSHSGLQLYQQGTRCQTSCSFGFRAKPGTSIYRVCATNGKWSGRDLQCEPVFCPLLKTADNSEGWICAASPGLLANQVGARCSSTCSDGYEPSAGSPTIKTCTRYGTWTRGEFGCKVKTCSVLPSVIDGGYSTAACNLQNATRPVGTICNVICRAGFELKAGSTAKYTCTQQGYWSHNGTSSACTAVTILTTTTLEMTTGSTTNIIPTTISLTSTEIISTIPTVDRNASTVIPASQYNTTGNDSTSSTVTERDELSTTSATIQSEVTTSSALASETISQVHTSTASLPTEDSTTVPGTSSQTMTNTITTTSTLVTKTFPEVPTTSSIYTTAAVLMAGDTTTSYASEELMTSTGTFSQVMNQTTTTSILSMETSTEVPIPSTTGNLNSTSPGGAMVPLMQANATIPTGDNTTTDSK